MDLIVNEAAENEAEMDAEGSKGTEIWNPKVLDISKRALLREVMNTVIVLFYLYFILFNYVILL